MLATWTVDPEPIFAVSTGNPSTLVIVCALLILVVYWKLHNKSYPSPKTIKA